jgi:hypothetical protein
MRRESTTTCRSSGLARRIALGAGALALATLAAPAAGQTEDTPPYPPLRWFAQESIDSHADADDQAMDILHWKEIEFGQPDKHWVYVTGWVTEIEDDEVVGTRFATFKYDAEFFDDGNPPPRAAEAFFPDPDDENMPLTTGQEYKAVALAMGHDLSTDEWSIYVVGQANWYDDGATGGATTDLNYAVIKYDTDLVQQWVRYYDGPVSGDDIPVDVGVNETFIVVTGTSPGDETGKDIATIALKNDGTFVTGLWPDDGWGGGIRRYDNIGGDDLAVELGPVVPVEETPESAPSLNAVVLGTSWGGSAKLYDYATLEYGGPDGELLSVQCYDNGANDIATGICGDVGFVWVTGYSEEPASSFGPGGPQLNADYLTISYFFYYDKDFPPERYWTERWDVASAGEPDYPYDIQFGEISGNKFVWVTGTGSNGSDYDAATVRYEHDTTPGPQNAWTDVWGVSTAAETGRALALSGDHPYITGRLKAATSDHMLGLKYQPTGSNPPYEEDWYKLFRNDSYGSGVEHEGRAIVVTPVGVFIAGVSKASGEGRQFTTWRYEE